MTPLILLNTPEMVAFLIPLVRLIVVDTSSLADVATMPAGTTRKVTMPVDGLPVVGFHVIWCLLLMVLTVNETFVEVVAAVFRKTFQPPFKSS